jgi:hypothetical protein
MQVLLGEGGADLISSEVKPGNVKYEFQPFLIIGRIPSRR